MEEVKNQDIQKPVDTEEPLDKNVRLMSPTRMVVRRFFRSRLRRLWIGRSPSKPNSFSISR